MRSRCPRLFGSLLVTLLLGAALAAAPPGSVSSPWVCPPCSVDCHDSTFDRPGSCPVCGMRLVREDGIRNVAVMVWDGVQVLDFTGPIDVFSATPARVYTVGPTEQITTNSGLTVRPAFGLGDAPEPDVLVLPGGGVGAQLRNAELMRWIETRAARAEQVLSVCTGAFVLARLGLLDGREATTYHSALDELATSGEGIRVRPDRRFVDSGSIVTAAGISAGIDAALHVVSKLNGLGTAQRVALGLEYDWRPESGYARAALADRHLGHVRLRGLEAELERTEGDDARWEKTWTVRAPAARVLERLAEELAGAEWSSPAAEGSTELKHGRWEFRDAASRSWTGEARVRAVPGQEQAFAVSVAVERN